MASAEHAERLTLVDSVTRFAPAILAGLTAMDVSALVSLTASGSRYGLAALKFQVAMAPAAYAFQELGARLGAHCGRGFPSLVEERFGRRCAEAGFALMACTAFYTTYAEFTGIAAIGRLLGVPRQLPVCGFAVLLLHSLFVSDVGQRLALYLAALLAFFVVLAVAAVARSGGGSWRNVGGLDVASADFDLVVVSVGGRRRETLTRTFPFNVKQREKEGEWTGGGVSRP